MQLHLGDNIEVLKTFPDNSIDAICTDAPYGLGAEPDALKLLQDWIEKGYHEVSNKGGFMGKTWDAFVPQPIFWKEAFRVLKHGGHVLCFFGTRTYDVGVLAMRIAGFEIRDCLQFLHGVGFPKGYNIANGIEGKLTTGSSSWNEWQKLDGEKEDRGMGYSTMHLEQGDRPNDYQKEGQRTSKVKYTTDEAKQWDGWSTQLKPANEPIVLARKPLQQGMTIAENVLANGVGGINIDACRIGESGARYNGRNVDSDIFGKYGTEKPKEDYNKGRFPTNVILQHSDDCECIGTKKVKSDGHHSHKLPENGGTIELGLKQLQDEGNIHADENGMEEVEEYNCVEDCPIRILNEQSGIRKSGAMKKPYVYKNTGFSLGQPTGSTKQLHESSEGYASRFFYTAKASRSERNYGLPEGERNIHPTVKPIKLMEYLIKLITPMGGGILDPFMGSGSTGIAAVQAGYDFIGIEMEEHSFKTAEKRINFAIKEREENIDKEKNKVTQAGLF